MGKWGALQATALNTRLGVQGTVGSDLGMWGQAEVAWGPDSVMCARGRQHGAPIPTCVPDRGGMGSQGLNCYMQDQEGTMWYPGA